jgi:hypothetical protein
VAYFFIGTYSSNADANRLVDTSARITAHYVADICSEQGLLGAALLEVSVRVSDFPSVGQPTNVRIVRLRSSFHRPISLAAFSGAM